MSPSEADAPPVEAVGTPVELIRSLAVLAEPPSDRHEALQAILGLGPLPSSSDHADLFVFQLYPYASVHLGEEGMIGGAARDRVAGFWRALGHEPPDEPDHLAALLGLYAGLAEQESERKGDEAEEGAERTLLRQARRALLTEHLGPWVFGFLQRVSELATHAYGPWADLLASTLRSEYAEPIGRVAGDCEARESADRHERAGGREESGGHEEALRPDEGAPATADLPAHLRSAPGLPDPRDEGAAAFLGGLLAPVRTGAILTRADLARVASTADVGLRAGERRYALEHLLAQDAEPVLRALAVEVRRQGDGHEERRPWLGPAADFLANRAWTTADLLEELASAVPDALADGKGAAP